MTKYIPKTTEVARSILVARMPPESSYRAMVDDLRLAELCLKERDEVIAGLKLAIEHSKEVSDIFEKNSKACSEEFEKRLVAENRLKKSNSLLHSWLQKYPILSDSIVRSTILQLGSTTEFTLPPIVVCLCGSTRFYEAFQKANYEETMAGKIVLSVGFYPHATQHTESEGCTPEQKIALDVLHKQKIDLAHEVLILNVGGYIGESTRSELDHAIAAGKVIRYLEPVNDQNAALVDHSSRRV
jgi:hypothetical protein